MASPGKPGDPRVQRTRQLLQQAMMDLLQAKRLETITVKDIAQRATVNRVTFYAHFKDKYDLLDSVLREGVREALAGSMQPTSELSGESLRSLTRTAFDFLQEVQNSCGADGDLDPLFQAAVQQEIHALVSAWLKQAAQGKTGQTGIDSAALAISWAIFGAGADWSRRPKPTQDTSEARARELVSVLLGGLAGLLTDEVPRKVSGE